MSAKDKSKWVPTSTLMLDPKNVRKHSERSIDAIGLSLSQFGLKKPVVVDINGIIRAGNGTAQAINKVCKKALALCKSTDADEQKEGIELKAKLIDHGLLDFEKLVPMVWANFTDLDAARAKAFAVADNRTAEISEWDDAGLVELLQELEGADFKTEDLGFTENELQALIETSMEAPPEPPQAPNLSDLFTDRDQDKDKPQIVKIVLEFKEEEARLVKKALLERARTAEQAIWNLLGLGE